MWRSFTFFLFTSSLVYRVVVDDCIPEWRWDVYNSFKTFFVIQWISRFLCVTPPLFNSRVVELLMRIEEILFLFVIPFYFRIFLRTFNFMIFNLRWNPICYAKNGNILVIVIFLFLSFEIIHFLMVDGKFKI